MAGRVYCVIPTYRPVGGVVKVFDYARHLVDIGREPVIISDEPYREASPLFEIERFQMLIRAAGIEHRDDFGFGVETDDLVLFSWPLQYEAISLRLAPHVEHGRVVHLVQNTRHANPGFLDGYARRLLTRPMTRISTNDVVADAIRPFAHSDSIHAVVPIGHDVAYFGADRTGGIDPHRPLRVAYTTWKSRLGDRLASETAGRGDFVFRRIGHEAAWPDLRELYHWADVFVGTPLPEEGTYLPGLEAMASGAIVVMPDVGGNRTYASFGTTCLEAAFDDAGSYLDALHRVRAMDAAAIDEMRRAGRSAASAHALEGERRALAAVLDRIEQEVEPRRRHPASIEAVRQTRLGGWE
jgi:glycosyltransferase involved in cell wall biosynthesis